MRTAEDIAAASDLSFEDANTALVKLMEHKHAQGIAPEKLAVMNRRERRVWNRGTHRRGTGRAPGKTGQPDWFVDMQESFRLKRAVIKEQRRQKRYLDQIPVENLIEYAKQPEALIKAIAPTYSTVWRLSQGRLDTLLAIPGVKPAALRKLRQALVVKGVTVLWDAP